MASKARHLVSQKKLRTVDKSVPNGSVDLDLTEIHPRMVCMGYPASGFESLYRNKYNDVLRYLDYKYGEHYMVYNLCKEKSYQYSQDKFHGRVRVFPFLDHHSAPLQLMIDFVRDAMAYLDEHAENVVVIHCKAGKGRTGVMACCLLMECEPSLGHSPDAVMRRYGQSRTSDGKGLTVPSQRRSVVYYARLVQDYGGVVPTDAPRVTMREIILDDIVSRIGLKAIRISINAAEDGTVEIRMRDLERADSPIQCVTTYRLGVNKDDVEVVTLKCEGEPRLRNLCGDLRVELYDNNGLSGILSINTLFMERRYPCSEFDKLNRLEDDTVGVEFVF
ncbi:phosphatidylinositol-3,4,5-trisphosphate 3-phosphatase [Strigomonas culicis]|uniref:phosphatidylinositol-3,4,5-trisphosphate 3-phosphatase n=1 Tax=Strigomonas culicis TaxID=28005 RepID=S9WG17_9TRYP|nr:phosphatidylinositol-3,4,5-trisphosphate 3-phosphatase [Strigomonas culicis]|eukprot:EPY34670.1 phosphatidylinositol-3,4,5-trisphosphate 3-phosphatase [Strigomonas culicis]